MSKRILWITLVVSLIMAMCVPAFAASSKGSTVKFTPADKYTFKTKANSDDVFTISIDKAGANEDVTISYKDADAETYGVEFPDSVTTNQSGSATFEVPIYSPTTTASKGFSFTVTVNNDGDKAKAYKATYYISVTGDAPLISSDKLNAISKSVRLWVNEEVGEDNSFYGILNEALVSRDGPLTFKATNLPSGLKVAVDDEGTPVITGTRRYLQIQYHSHE